jgi:hypothetical protein
VGQIFCKPGFGKRGLHTGFRALVFLSSWVSMFAFVNFSCQFVSYIGGIWPQIGSTWLPPCPPMLYSICTKLYIAIYMACSHLYTSATTMHQLTSPVQECQLATVYKACTDACKPCIMYIAMYSFVQMSQFGRAGWEPSATNLGPDATNITFV